MAGKTILGDTCYEWQSKKKHARVLSRDHYSLLAEILYIAGMNMQRDIWKDLVARLSRKFAEHDVKFLGKQFLENTGYFDDDNDKQ